MSKECSSFNHFVPDRFSLLHYYPNPFNPATKIKFEILLLNPPLTKGGNGGVVTLKFCEIPGKEIATRVNEKLQPGTYEAEFDGSRLSSGIYFYTLIINDVSSKQLFKKHKSLFY
jgi:hypothetical protein